jgi:hypothetical protein
VLLFLLLPLGVRHRLTEVWLILFKAKAWLDLNHKMEQGEHVDSRDIKKHRNDIIRLCAEISLEPCTISGSVKEDIELFIRKLHISDSEIKNLKLGDVRGDDIVSTLKDIYTLN